MIIKYARVGNVYWCTWPRHQPAPRRSIRRTADQAVDQALAAGLAAAFRAAVVSCPRSRSGTLLREYRGAVGRWLRSH
jgi:hypothetical protein